MVFMEMSLEVVSAQLTKGRCAVITPSLLQTSGMPSITEATKYKPSTPNVTNSECHSAKYMLSLFTKIEMKIYFWSL